MRVYPTSFNLKIKTSVEPSIPGGPPTEIRQFRQESSTPSQANPASYRPRTSIVESAASARDPKFDPVLTWPGRTRPGSPCPVCGQPPTEKFLLSKLPANVQRGSAGLGTEQRLRLPVILVRTPPQRVAGASSCNRAADQQHGKAAKDVRPIFLQW